MHLYCVCGPFPYRIPRFIYSKLLTYQQSFFYHKSLHLLTFVIKKRLIKNKNYIYKIALLFEILCFVLFCDNLSDNCLRAPFTPLSVLIQTSKSVIRVRRADFSNNCSHPRSHASQPPSSVSRFEYEVVIQKNEATKTKNLVGKFKNITTIKLRNHFHFHVVGSQ